MLSRISLSLFGAAAEGPGKRRKIVLMAGLLIFACGLKLFGQVVLKTGVIYTHFFYVPIILAAIWGKRRGVVVPVFLALFLIITDFMLSLWLEIGPDLLRITMFLLVFLIVSTLKEEVDKTSRNLRESENYRILAEKSFAGVYVVQDGIFRYINPHAASYAGYHAAELIGSRGENLIISEDREAAQRHAVEMLRGERTTPYEYRVATQDGRVRWIMETVSPAVYEGRPAVIGNSMDVTEMREVREKLEEMRKLESSILEAIPHAVLGLKNRRVVFANNAVEKVFGWRPEEIIGRETRVLYKCDEDYRDMGRRLYELLAQQRTCELEVVCRHREGHEITCRFTAAVIGETLADGRVVVTYEDITARKRMEEEKAGLEEQLLQAQKMEAVGTLAGGIAHDFNNILGVILGYAELAYNELLDTTRKAYLDHVITAADRAKNLVQQILAFSRHGEKDMKPLAVAPLVKETMQMLRASIPSSIDIQVNVTREPTAVLANVSHIHQLVMNLCTNAAQAMRGMGGVLSVDLENVYVNQGCVLDLAPGSYVRLSVRDTGPGIEEAVINRIFDPFFTTKKVGEGTGLGLSVVYGIVKTYGGGVTVESEIGKGTVFQVYLPATTSMVQNEENEPGPLPRGREHVLLVDDEKELLDIGEKMLKSLGYTVSRGSNADEALDLFRKYPLRYDLLMTDMTMPGMTGLALAAEIRAIRPNLPIALCTGCSEWVSEDEVKRLGLGEVAMKPLSRSDLALLVRRALDAPSIAARN
ncbi:MAG: PAS domain S-box protein [Deltaproteobacteria bacterium]|nr:PAS domain S-box protein [Deltaproteobacteria bacterium]